VACPNSSSLLAVSFFGESHMLKTKLSNPPQPVHVEGIYKGEEGVFDFGREPGRGEKMYRTARDSTSINAKARAPILPIMPEIPPA
jgi:hypothetical protein